MQEGQHTSDTKTIHLRIPRWAIIAAGVIFLLLALSVAIWYFRWYQPTWNWYNRASITLKVREGEMYPLKGAQVQVGGITVTTDANGKVTLTGLVAGSHDFFITKPGYIEDKETIVLKRGSNDLHYISLSKQVAPAYAIKGFVQDYVGGAPLVDVSVQLANKIVHTDPSGAYTFEQVAPGDLKLILSKDGYLQKEMKLTLVDKDIVTAQVPLVPSGQALFVSNRDGSRHLYTANYDGSNQKKLAASLEQGEDFNPVFGPEAEWVAFSSTRDRVKSTYGDDLAKLYIVQKDGQNLKKISDNLSPSFTPLWSPSGADLFFSGYTSPSIMTAEYYLYNLATRQLTNLGNAAYSPAFSPDGTLFAYSVPEIKQGTDGNTQYTNTLKLLSLHSGEQKTVAQKEQSFTGLQFATDNTTLSYDTVVDNAAHRFQINLNSLTETEIPTNPTSKRVLVAAPRGNNVAFVEVRDGKRDLFIVGSDGNKEKQLTSLGTLVNQPPVWHESGRYLFFTSQKEGESALYIEAVRGGAPQKIADVYLDSQSP